MLGLLLENERKLVDVLELTNAKYMDMSKSSDGTSWVIHVPGFRRPATTSEVCSNSQAVCSVLSTAFIISHFGFAIHDSPFVIHAV